VEIRDTAGLRTIGDEIEAEGVARAKQEIAAADLVLFVADNTAPWDGELFAEVAALSAMRPSASLLVVHNKLDLAAVPSDGRPAGQAVSAKRNQGIGELCQWAIATLMPAIPPRGSAIPFTATQVRQIEDLLKRARSGTP
jgi:tRNA modification GTPase